MDKRKELILNTIITEHIKTGAPVGSGILVEKYKLDISPATVRNEMAALEEEGYIMQPYTSAGRVPTEKAYQLYLSNINIERIGKIEKNSIDEVLSEYQEANMKEAAKILCQLSGNAVFWAFHRHNVYYTGISNLFQQPEFSQLDIIHNISNVIDRIDEIVNDMFEGTKNGVHTMLGSANPFGEMCGTVLVKYRLGEQDGLFGVLGPMRMDYEKNLAIAKYVNSKIGKISN